MTAAADIARALDALARERPAFHSEADFQHALAWRLPEIDPGTEVRLERPTPWEGPRGAVDIWLRGAGGAAAIELKYWTRGAELTVIGERFQLKEQGAQPLGRYDFWKDVARIERLVGDGHADGGYVAAVTNDQSYWNRGDAGTIDAAFRIHEGSEAHGTLAWSPRAGDGTTKDRESPLALRGRYVTSWRDYSAPAPGRPGGEFRCLLVGVGEGLRRTRGAGSAWAAG